MAIGSSEAYELNTVQETEQPRLRAMNSPQKSAEIKKKQAKRLSGARLIYTIFFSVILVVAVAWMIILQASVTELSDGNAVLKEELSILKSEESRLRNELSAKTSAEKVDEFIEQQGMIKTQPDQIQYFATEEGEVIEVTDPAPEGVFETIGAAIAGWFGG